MSKRVEEFYVPGHSYIPRGEALRALIAATYRTAKVLRTFNTDDVFARVEGYNEYDFRKALGGSKLIAVALRKAAKQGMCYHGQGFTVGGPICNKRRKGVWVSKIADPTYTS